MYSGIGTGTFGSQLLYDGVVTSLPISLTVGCSDDAFDLSSMAFSSSDDLHVLPLSDASELQFKIINVANNVPNCDITTF
jgi:hypothetical protein